MFEYLDTTLSPTIQASVREHLGHCQACRKVFDEEQRFFGSLSALLKHSACSLQIRPGLQEKVMLRVQQHPRPSITRFPTIHIGPITRWALAAAACLLIVSITTFLTWQQPPAMDVSPSLRPAMRSPVASLPAKHPPPASIPQVEEQNRAEPSQSPLNAKWAKRQSQLAAALETAMAKVKDHQESRLASIEAKRQHDIQIITQRAAWLNQSAATLETAMAEIKARPAECFSKIAATRQACFQKITQRAVRLNQSAATLETARLKIQADQDTRFSTIKDKQRRLFKKIHAPQKPTESS